MQSTYSVIYVLDNTDRSYLKYHLYYYFQRKTLRQVDYLKPSFRCAIGKFNAFQFEILGKIAISQKII